MDAKVTNSEQTANGKDRKSKHWESHKSLSAALATVVLLIVSMDDNLFGSKQFLIGWMRGRGSRALRWRHFLVVHDSLATRLSMSNARTFLTSFVVKSCWLIKKGGKASFQAFSLQISRLATSNAPPRCCERFLSGVAQLASKTCLSLVLDGLTCVSLLKSLRLFWQSNRVQPMLFLTYSLWRLPLCARINGVWHSWMACTRRQSTSLA